MRCGSCAVKHPRQCRARQSVMRMELSVRRGAATPAMRRRLDRYRGVDEDCDDGNSNGRRDSCDRRRCNEAAAVHHFLADRTVRRVLICRVFVVLRRSFAAVRAGRNNPRRRARHMDMRLGDVTLECERDERAEGDRQTPGIRPRLQPQRNTLCLKSTLHQMHRMGTDGV